MGWFQDFVANPVGTVSNTVGNVVSNPSGAIGDFWNTGGRNAAAAAAAYYGGGYLPGAETAATSAAGETLAGLGAGAGAGMAGAGAAGGFNWASLIPAATSLFSGAQNRSAAQNAAGVAGQASDRAAALQYQTFQEQKALQEPWRAAGVNALSKMQDQYGGMPAAFTGKVDLTQDPGYAFRLAEGEKALGRNAAVRSGVISGGALKAAQRFGQDLGSQEYQNAYNRALTGYNANVARETTGYNRLASMAGLGQTSANTLTNAAGSYGTNVGNAMINQGVNAANADIAGTRAMTSAYGDIAEQYGKNTLNFANLYGRNAAA
jgi:hypothetical protein